MINIFTYVKFVVVVIGLILIYISINLEIKRDIVIIMIANSFKKWSIHFIKGEHNCNSNLRCIITGNYSKKVDFLLYNIWTFSINYTTTNKQKKLLWSPERMSINNKMINVSLGLNKEYYGGIDYRLFYSPYHFSQPYLGMMPQPLDSFINHAEKNIHDIHTFLSRKSIIYIQRRHYSKRTAFVKEIMKLIEVDSYGKNLNNKKWPDGKSKVDLIKMYKFCLAIENAIQNSNNKELFSDNIDIDYSTEKLYDCLEGGAIPVYYGPRSSHLFLPNNKSGIIMGEYEKLEDIVSYIKKIENSKEELSKYISWPKSYSKSWYKRFSDTFRYSDCKLCEWANDNK